MKYPEAVTFAKALRRRAEALWLNRKAMGPLGSEALHSLCYWHWRGIPGRRAQMRAALVKLAGEDAKAQAWLRVRIAEALEAGEAIPEPFRAWAVAFLRDPSPPKGKGGRPGDPVRDEILAYAVAALVKRGLPRSRNITSPARSAVDAVAAAWGMDWRAVDKAAMRGEALYRNKSLRDCFA